jgi:hypothetical protein
MLNETHALYMVQLTRFVLESYSRDRADAIVMMSKNEELDNGPLAVLLLTELTAYLNRRRVVPTAPPIRKVRHLSRLLMNCLSASACTHVDFFFLFPQPSSASVVLPEFNYSKALSERLQILRFVYGLSSAAEMTSQQIDHIWSLCTLPVDREAIMDFLADASNSDIGPIMRPDNKTQIGSGNQLHAVFSSEVCIHVFETLFCAPDVGWDSLGEMAFSSFQTLFKNLVQGKIHDPAIKDRAIDALWRISLSAGNENVATNAMTELLSAYSQNGEMMQPNKANTENSPQNIQIQSGHLFSKRIFEYLSQVKDHLQRGDNSSLRSAERCIKILKRAFDMSTLGGGVSAVAARLRRTNGTLNDFLKEIPHGLRGVSSCKTVFVMAKKLGGTCERFAIEVHLLQTLSSIKLQVSERCNHDVQMIKLSNVTGRSSMEIRPPQRPNFSAFPDSVTAADLGVTTGSELIFMLSDKIVESGPTLVPNPNAFMLNDNALDLSGLLDDEEVDNSFGVFFDTLVRHLSVELFYSGHLLQWVISDPFFGYVL